MRRMIFSSICLSLILFLGSFVVRSCFAHNEELKLPSGCEACKTYHEHLFQKFGRHGRVESLGRDYSVCQDHSWHLSDQMYSEEFKKACETIESTKDSHFGEGTAVTEYRQWPLHEEIDYEDHASHQLLVKVKYEQCVKTLGVCSESDLPQPLDRSRTDCEKCGLVVKSLAGFLSRYDLDHVSDYRREGLLEGKMDDRNFCSSFDLQHFDDPYSGNTQDLQDYCKEFISTKYTQIHASFHMHKIETSLLLKDLCPSPCDLGKQEL